MANWANPVLTSLYSNVLTEISARLNEAATAFPSSGSYSNLPTGTVSFRNSKWQTWNGTSWVDSASSYAINISGTSSNITGTLAVNRGGTNLTSYTIGDILYASGSTTLTRLAGVVVGNVLRSGGVGAAPSWGKISLTDHTDATLLPVTKGGTGVSNITGLIKGNGTNAMTAAVAGTDYAAAAHTHQYLPLLGGTLTGNLTIASGTTEMRLTTGSSGGYFFGSSTTLGVRNTSIVLFGVNASTGNTTCAGNLAVSGTVSASSDYRLKSEIETITDGLNKVLALRGVSYKTLKGVNSLGLIAQEVEGVLPELVITDEKGYKSLAYANIVSVLVEAVKELTKRVESLEK
jgi:hypothetical protein